MDKSEFEKKLAALPVVTPDNTEIPRNIALDEETTSDEHEQFKRDMQYNGRILIRLPKSLHKGLIEEAKKEGISLNQFILYKLAKDGGA